MKLSCDLSTRSLHSYKHISDFRKTTKLRIACDRIDITVHRVSPDEISHVVVKSRSRQVEAVLRWLVKHGNSLMVTGLSAHTAIRIADRHVKTLFSENVQKPL